MRGTLKLLCTFYLLYFLLQPGIGDYDYYYYYDFFVAFNKTLTSILKYGRGGKEEKEEEDGNSNNTVLGEKISYLF